VRVAIASDIHGNLSALEAVVADIGRRAPDRVLHCGDLVLMRPRPAAVVDRLRELRWEGVLGNTDELLWRPQELARQERAAPKLALQLRLMFDEYAPTTRDLLGRSGSPGCAASRARHGWGTWSWSHAAPGELWRAPMADA
jgi:hypothetical protein